MKPGLKTTEFWLTLAAAVAPYVVGAVPPQYAAIASALVAGVYTLSRGVVKAMGPSGEPAKLPSYPPLMGPMPSISAVGGAMQRGTAMTPPIQSNGDR